MNIFISALLITSSFLGLSFLNAPKVKTKDLQRLTGAQWIGTLSYLDYGTNKKVSIPSKLTVTQSAEDKLSWVFEYQYPDEPKANSKEKITISRDGKTIDGETVVGRTNLAGDMLKIVTEKTGMDNDKKALFRLTYLSSETDFSIKKEVKYEDATEFFMRNEYSWKR
ncbi:MAG: hypothetical protein ABI954_04980 [Pyrinomonadaceae bacterium]